MKPPSPKHAPYSKGSPLLPKKPLTPTETSYCFKLSPLLQRKPFTPSKAPLFPTRKLSPACLVRPVDVTWGVRAWSSLPWHTHTRTVSPASTAGTKPEWNIIWVTVRSASHSPSPPLTAQTFITLHKTVAFFHTALQWAIRKWPFNLYHIRNYRSHEASGIDCIFNILANCSWNCSSLIMNLFTKSSHCNVNNILLLTDIDYESQHKEQQPHYNERRATGRDRLIHLGSTINKHGGTEEDVKARIQKARVAFIMLRTIWSKTNQN